MRKVLDFPSEWSASIDAANCRKVNDLVDDYVLLAITERVFATLSPVSSQPNRRECFSSVIEFLIACRLSSRRCRDLRITACDEHCRGKYLFYLLTVLRNNCRKTFQFSQTTHLCLTLF